MQSSTLGKGKGHERRVPELIPVLGSQPASDRSTEAIYIYIYTGYPVEWLPEVGCHSFRQAQGYLPTHQASPPIGR